MALHDFCGQRPREPAELGSKNQAHRNGCSMTPLVALKPFNGVPERVTVVEELPRSRLSEVLTHYSRLNRDRLLDKFKSRVASSGSSAAANSDSSKSRMLASWVNPTFTTSAIPAR